MAKVVTVDFINQMIDVLGIESLAGIDFNKQSFESESLKSVLSNYVKAQKSLNDFLSNPIMQARTPEGIGKTDTLDGKILKRVSTKDNAPITIVSVHDLEH